MIRKQKKDVFNIISSESEEFKVKHSDKDNLPLLTD